MLRYSLCIGEGERSMSKFNNPHIDFVTHFRQTGECPTCSARHGTPCPNCRTHCFAGENYCPSCGFALNTAEDIEAASRVLWTPHELALLQETVALTRRNFRRG